MGFESRELAPADSEQHSVLNSSSQDIEILSCMHGASIARDVIARRTHVLSLA